MKTMNLARRLPHELVRSQRQIRQAMPSGFAPVSGDSHTDERQESLLPRPNISHGLC